VQPTYSIRACQRRQTLHTGQSRSTHKTDKAHNGKDWLSLCFVFHCVQAKSATYLFSFLGNLSWSRRRRPWVWLNLSLAVPSGTHAAKHSFLSNSNLYWCLLGTPQIKPAVRACSAPLYRWHFSTDLRCFLFTFVTYGYYVGAIFTQVMFDPPSSFLSTSNQLLFILLSCFSTDICHQRTKCFTVSHFYCFVQYIENRRCGENQISFVDY